MGKPLRQSKSNARRTERASSLQEGSAKESTTMKENRENAALFLFYEFLPP